MRSWSLRQNLLLMKSPTPIYRTHLVSFIAMQGIHESRFNQPSSQRG